MYSRTEIIGHVGKDPEVRTFPNGNCVARFPVATSRKWKDKDGNRQEKTNWHSVEVYQHGANGIVNALVKPYVKKGQLIQIVGETTTRKDDEGRYWTQLEVAGVGGVLNLLGDRPEGGGGNGGSQNSNDSAADLDDDIPF